MTITDRQKIIILLAWIFLVGLSGCSGFAYNGPAPTPQGQLPVVSDLRDFYQSLGGEKELGPAISAPFYESGAICQYTTNVKMCYNSSAPSEADRSYLAPIGDKIHFDGDVINHSGTPQVYEGFSDFYHKKFFGLRYVGKPLTGIRYNPQNRRLEQYFEKMGFYTLIDDPQPTIHLLAYGVYACGEQCAHGNAASSGIIGWNKGVPVLNPPSLARLGSYNLFGNPLTNPYIAPDENLEQVLEKVVVYIPEDNPATIRFRNLSVLLNLPYSAPGTQHYGAKDNMVFYPVKGDLGYHVPVAFDQFIALHGGKEISGKPLVDPFPVDVNGITIARQCFENYCLDYYPNTAQGQEVKLVSLGQEYIDKQGVKQDVFTFSRNMVDLIAAEEKPQISNKESQVIQIALYTSKGHMPISDIESFVMLGMPGGEKITRDFPPTDKDGLAKVTISPLSTVENGVIIPYIVCLNVPAQEQICTSESFLVWNTN